MQSSCAEYVLYRTALHDLSNGCNCAIDENQSVARDPRSPSVVGRISPLNEHTFFVCLMFHILPNPLSLAQVSR